MRLGDDDWAGRCGAVAAVRTLLAHHADVFAGKEEDNGIPGLLRVVVPLVVSAVADRRSAVQTNGLRCVAELFRCVFAIGEFCPLPQSQAHGGFIGTQGSRSTELARLMK